MESDNQFFYCNGSEIAVTLFDFNFKFLRQGTPAGAQPGVEMQPENKDSLTVAMSPAHAKTMLYGYFNSVKDYEKNFGSITISAEMQKLFNETFGDLVKK